MKVKCESDKHNETIWFKNAVEVTKCKHRWRITLEGKRKRWIHKEYEVTEVVPNDSHLPFGDVEFYEE